MEARSGRSSIVGRKRVPWMHYAIRAGGSAIRLTGLWRASSQNAMKIAVSRLELRCPRLPPTLDGLTILHLSDLHFETVPSAINPVIEALSQINADVAVITGDFQIDHDRTNTRRAVELTRPVLDAIRSRRGIYGVLGNHDSWQVVDPLERLGVRMLINEHIAVGEGTNTVRLIGIDDIHAFYTEDAVRAVQEACTGFRVLLAHTPELADVAASAGCDLYLAGHTHGGQICLPNGRPLLTGLDRHRDLVSGYWRFGAMHGYTNRGLGVASMPVRMNCPAEIAVLRLRSVPASEAEFGLL